MQHHACKRNKNSRLLNIITTKTRITTHNEENTYALRIVHGRGKESRFAHLGLGGGDGVHACSQHANTHRHVQIVVREILLIELVHRRLRILPCFIHHHGRPLRMSQRDCAHLKLILGIHVHFHRDHVRNQPKQLDEGVLVQRGVETADEHLRGYT